MKGSKISRRDVLVGASALSCRRRVLDKGFVCRAAREPGYAGAD